jgi:hypothetical protein
VVNIIKGIIKSIIIIILLTLTLFLQGCLPELVKKAEKIEENENITYERKDYSYNDGISYSSNSQEYSGTNISKQYSENSSGYNVELHAVESELQTIEGEEDGELELMGCSDEEIECELSDLHDGEEESQDN